MEKGDNAPLTANTREIAVLSSKEIEDIKKLVSGFNYEFYVILLGRDENEFIKNYVAENWTNLHYMSGPNCLFLSIYPPKKLDTEIANYWNKKMGRKYRNLQKKAPTTAWIYEYARNLSIDFSKLPCLFIGVGLDEQTGFVVKIPEVLKDDLTYYFEFIFSKVLECSKLNQNNRLKALEKKIDKYYRAKLAKIYIKRHWMEYVKPKEILKTAISQLLSMIPGFPKKEEEK